jgi:hypothetical protein
MADQAEVVFKYVDGGSSSGPTTSGSGTSKPEKAKPVDDAAAKSTHHVLKETTQSVKDVLKRSGVAVESAGKSLRDVLKDTASRIGSILQKTTIGKIGSAIGKGVGEAREVLKGTKAGTILEGGISAAKGVGGAVLNGATKAIGALGVAGSAAVAGIAVLGYAASKASDALRNIAGEVGKYSGEFMAARGKNKALKTQQDIQRAQRFGTRIARQEEVDGRLERAWTGVTDGITEFFAPLADVWTETKDILASCLESLTGMEAEQKRNNKGNPFKAIDGLRKKFEKLESIEAELAFLQKRKGVKVTNGMQLADNGLEFKDVPGISFDGNR